MKRRYQLTDGTDIFAEADMDGEEYALAQRKARRATAGMLHWCEAEASISQTAARELLEACKTFVTGMKRLGKEVIFDDVEHGLIARAEAAIAAAEKGA